MITFLTIAVIMLLALEVYRSLNIFFNIKWGFKIKTHVYIKNLSNNPMPTYVNSSASGIDLRSNEDLLINPNEREVVRTGIYLEIPENLEGQIRARSGLASKNGIMVLNAPGTIDSDYRGEIMVILFNTGKRPFAIAKGDRIAQLVISPVEKVKLIETEDLIATSRGTGGLGHTGVK